MGTICPCIKHNKRKIPSETIEEQPLRQTEIFFEERPEEVFDLNSFEEILKSFGLNLNNPRQNIPSSNKKEIELQIKNLDIPKNKKLTIQTKANKERKLSINDDDFLYSNTIPVERPDSFIPDSPEKSEIRKKKNEQNVSASSPITTLDSYHLYSEDEKNTYSQNFELENVVSLWDWDFLNLFKKIELKEYIVMEKVGDNLKLKDKRSSSIYELSLLQVNYENLSKLAFLWSKLHILSNLKKNKSTLNLSGFCSITSINILPIKSNVDFGRINFNIFTLKESGLASLQLLIENGFTFKISELYTFLVQMIQLGFQSEELKIANRFINPSNIILSEKLDHWKISDYSFACILEGSIKQVLKPKLPQNYSFYQAPELLNKNGFYNPFLADVFSLGLVALAGVGVEERNLRLFVSRQKDIEFILDQYRAKIKNQNNELEIKIEEVLRRMLVLEAAGRESFSKLNDMIIKINAPINNFNSREISAITDRIPLFDAKDKWKLLKTQGDSYFAMGLFEKSFNFYSDALQNLYASPERCVDIEIELEIKKSISKFECGDLNFSLKSINSAYNLNPKSIQKEIEILNLKSLILCKLKKFMESIKCLQIAFLNLKKLNDTLLKKRLETEIYKILCELILDQCNDTKKVYSILETIIEIYNSSREFLELEIFGLIYFADCLNKLNIPSLAIKKYLLAFEKTKLLYGNHHPLIPFYYQMMGETFFNNNEILKSKLCFKRAVYELKIIFGKKSYETANGKAKYGKVLLFNKEHKTALLLLKESLEIVFKYDGECKFMSQIWISIAEAYILYKDYDKGLKFYQRTLEFYKDNKDKRICSPLEMIDLIESIGHVYFLKGDKQKMISYYYEALILRKEISPPNSEALADAYENIGDLLFELDEYRLCLENYLHALNAFNSIQNSDSNRIIRLNQLIGRMYYNLGEKSSAITFIKTAFNLIDNHRQIFDFDDQIDSKFDTIELMGSIYYELCDFDESLKYYLLLQENRKEKKEEANCLYNIGVIYYKKQNYGLAEEFIKKSLKIREKFKNEEVKLISALKLLSNILHNQQKIEEEKKNEEIIKILCSKSSQKYDNYDGIKTSLIRPSNI